MTVERADEVMAGYLLKGGKMLAKSCKVCGYPLFEYKRRDAVRHLPSP